MKAHSKSEYKRLVAMGADVEPMARTCGECLHHTPLRRGLCRLRNSWAGSNCVTCPSFNAPTGLRWDKADDDYSPERIPREHDKWFLRTDLGIVEGYVEWCAIDCDPLLWSAYDARTELEVASGTLHDCARALVDAVRGAT